MTHKTSVAKRFVSMESPCLCVVLDLNDKSKAISAYGRISEGVVLFRLRFQLSNGTCLSNWEIFRNMMLSK